MPNRPQDFRPGSARPANSGRRAGTPNKVTQLLKDALLLAAEAVGEVQERVVGGDGEDDARPRIKYTYNGKDGLIGYLRWAAVHHPASFLTLLGKVLPMQVRVEGGTRRTFRTIAEVREELQRRGIPLDRLLREPRPLPPPAPTAHDVYGQQPDADDEAEDYRSPARGRTSH